MKITICRKSLLAALGRTSEALLARYGLARGHISHQLPQGLPISALMGSIDQAWQPRSPLDALAVLGRNQRNMRIEQLFDAASRTASREGNNPLATAAAIFCSI